MIMGVVEQRNLQGVTMNLTLAKLDNQRRPDYRQQSIETVQDMDESTYFKL